MRTPFALLFLFCGVLLGQGTQVDCTPNPYTITSSTPTAGLPNSNSVTPCVSWRVTYNSTGFASVSILFQTSPDNSTWTSVPNTICSSTVAPPCMIDGANPSTATDNGTFAVRAYGRYVRLNPTVSVSGTVTARVYGYKGLSANAGAGSGSGGGGSASGIPCAENPYTTSGTKTCTHNIGIAPPTMHILEAFDQNGTAPTAVGWTVAGTNADTFVLTNPPSSNMYVYVSTGGVGPKGSTGAAGPAGPAGGTITVTNDTGTGTTTNLLAKINSSGNAVLATTADTAIPVYLCTSGCGTSGSATLLVGGSGTCQTDAAGVTAAHFIIASTATNGRCEDGGATAPTSGWVVGIAGGTAAANATFTLLNAPGYNAAAAGRTGSIDYQQQKSVVTGNATLYTTTIPAGTMGAGQCIRVSLGFIWTTVNSNSQLATIHFGATSITSIQWGSSGHQGRTGAQEIEICNNSGSQTAQQANSVISMFDNGFVTGAALAATPAENTANAVVVSFVTSGGNGSDQVTPLWWHVWGPM